MTMLKTGEVDVAYDLDVSAAEEVKQNPKFRLAFSGEIGTFYLDFLELHALKGVGNRSPIGEGSEMRAVCLLLDRGWTYQGP